MVMINNENHAATPHVRPRATKPGTRPTTDISIEFEIRPKFALLWFKTYSSNHDEILSRRNFAHITTV